MQAGGFYACRNPPTGFTGVVLEVIPQAPVKKVLNKSSLLPIIPIGDETDSGVVSLAQGRCSTSSKAVAIPTFRLSLNM